MSDLISRQETLDALDLMCDVICPYSKKQRDVMCGACAMGNAFDVIRDQPSVQPETAKRIVGKSRNGMILWYQCEICNEPIDEQDTFCRGCGRRLVSE